MLGSFSGRLTEHLGLRWSDVDWERNRITVRSPKTEHNPGGESRQTPLFPELRPYLEEAFEQAGPGTEYVIARYRAANSNLRTQMLRIIGRAGVAPWPKLFQNLRATRETELAEQYPMHVVCAWIGNSQQIAAKHYLQVTDGHFGKAAQNAAQHSHELGRTEWEAQTETPAFPVEYEGLPYCTVGQVPPRGVEPLSSD
ncbi:tyrosine-type recombinase/integrase [Planctomycetota bacterium]